MSIKLKRVELSNIRSHKHVIFEPEDDGITAISGPNGTGKSTIVDSIAWVLYGTKPQGVSKVSAIYREGAVFGEDRCFATVELEVDGQCLKVERRMVNKGGAVECEVWEFISKDDGTSEYKQIAGPAVSHAEPYIRKRLKMDEKGFLSAILVQQKQVDQLISASPRERAAVIEKLTGISSITAALVESRQEYNSLKKVASISTIDETELEKLKVERTDLEESIKDQVVSVDSLKTKVLEIKTSGIKLREEVSTEAQKVEEAEGHREELTVVNTRIESREEELERLTEERKAKRAKLSLVSSGTSLSEIEPKVNALKNNLRKKERESATLESSLKSSRNRLETYSEVIEDSDLKTVEAVTKAREAVEESHNTAIEQISAERASALSADSEIKKLRKAISVLSKGNGTCPTCLQHVDDVSAAVGVLEKEIAELDEAKSATSSKIDELQEVERSTRSDLADFNSLIEALNNSAVLSSEIEVLSSQVNSVGSDIIALEGELKAIERVYNEAKRHEETKLEYDGLLSRAKAVSDEIEKLKSRQNTIEDYLKNSGTITSAELTKLRKKLEESRITHSELAMKYSESRGELKLCKERRLHLIEKIESHEKEVKRYKDLLKSVEVAASSTNLIEEFREERIKNSIPVIEVYASDLMSRFTEGVFTRLKIDGKFNTTVCLADGTERAVGLLSGGELSAASMALRLAISMLLNSGASTNLIILDEVLVSQDAARAELILTTVREVCKGQVVLIAHNDSIDGIADKVVELEAK